MYSAKRIVICSSPNGRGIERYSDYLSDIIKAVSIKCKRSARSFVMWETIGIVRYVRWLANADCIVFSNTRVSPLLWLVLDWRRVVVVVHDLMDTNADMSAERSDSKYLRSRQIVRTVNSWVMKRSIEKAGHLIFNSQYTKSEVRRWIGNEVSSSCVISPPPSFEGLINEVEIRGRGIGVSGRTCKILAISGTSLNKAHEEYMIFHREIEGRLRTRVELVIHGIDIKKAESKFVRWVAQCAKQVDIRFKSTDESLLEDYLDCDFLVSLSTREGFGIPVADALGFGVPVVARSIEAYREIKERLDNEGIVYLAEDTVQCAEYAVDLVKSIGKKLDRKERIERYREFCVKCRREAESRLKLWEDGEGS